MRTNKDDFVGLTTVNVELTSRCNKNTCWMCGRRKLEKDHPDLCNWGDMHFRLVTKIAKQLPRGIIVQFHNNGEPTCYPLLQEALACYYRQIRCFNTNGKLLVEKRSEIVNNLERLTISVVEGDKEADEQYETVKEFIDFKKTRKPYMVYRLLGNIEKKERWYKLPGLVATRTLHNPMGSFDYKRKATIPEHGICLDLLSHLTIDRFGKVSVCVRFDPERKLVIGDLNTKASSLRLIWHTKKRRRIIKAHLNNRRSEIPVCNKCTFYGCPTPNE